MTLFKQMALAISLIIIIMLGAVMAINYNTSKKDMVQSLYETTVNNISSLTNQLSQSADDIASIESIIDSEFDSGYYHSIEFESNDSKSDYKQVDNSKVVGVPSWFINFSDIKIDKVSSDVSSGWMVVGNVSVEADTSIVYKSLYKMFINLLYLFIISVIVSLVLLSLMLHFILKPLYAVQNQAESILKNEFIIQKGIPYTTEFKDVVVGMNTMVSKVEEIFKKGNDAVKRNKELLYNDPITKLFNRRYLMIKLPDLIKEENKANGGICIFLALGGAEILNQVLGRQKADNLFLELAKIFNEITKEYDDKVISRVNGTEFTLVLANCESDAGKNITRLINRSFTMLLTANDLNHTKVFINMGLYRYKPTTTITELLTSTDNALSLAKSKDDLNIHLYEEKDDENALGKEQWRTIIEDSIQNNYFSLRFWPTINTKTKKIDHKVMTFTIDGGENKKYFYGDFIAPAINLGLVGNMYIVTLRELITKRHKELDGTRCSIRLSNDFIKEEKAFKELSTLFAEHAKTLKFKLSFEVTDNFAINNTVVVKSFVNLFKKYGFEFGINSFTGESNDFTYLQDLNPIFIKADCAFLLDQSQDSMSAIHVITDSLSIDIIATFVKTKEELDQLQAMHINSVQGPITDIIQEIKNV